ncbi:hypothetical protein H4Q26_006934 [Puccinia striiformis f. sp. tritici PST-130]|uniref:Uncharacterized protein n=1 Tax=Puccinia striiformis f. sp. tritici PST-78 TaxID=1165861 RepID=A0A0L0VC35_9BASI|nr:hypothetical protein Pst134EB_003637 [Puccinia striiformis f. sp. tritici]KAI9609943.1 hypothetical protein H4Q26_006934 [Puccinia striiformis f. sp. tritici PST-130]KNE96833.1 hypothetical protein PSTG_09818 [Puccinia striiformis f. sp. tritici PST-78]
MSGSVATGCERYFEQSTRTEFFARPHRVIGSRTPDDHSTTTSIASYILQSSRTAQWHTAQRHIACPTLSQCGVTGFVPRLEVGGENKFFRQHVSQTILDELAKMITKHPDKPTQPNNHNNNNSNGTILIFDPQLAHLTGPSHQSNPSTIQAGTGDLIVPCSSASPSGSSPSTDSELVAITAAPPAAFSSSSADSNHHLHHHHHHHHQLTLLGHHHHHQFDHHHHQNLLHEKLFVDNLNHE